MTPQQEHKLVERALRTIPVQAIAPSIATDEALVYAQFVRWMKTRPERGHDIHEAAVAFVRSSAGGAS